MKKVFFILLTCMLVFSCTKEEVYTDDSLSVVELEKADLEKAVSNFEATYESVVNSPDTNVKFEDVYFRTSTSLYVLKYDSVLGSYNSDLEYVGPNDRSLNNLNKSSYLCSWSDDTTNYVVYSDDTGYHVHIQSCIGGQCSDGAVIDYSMIYAHFVCWQNGEDR